MNAHTAPASAQVPEALLEQIRDDLVRTPGAVDVPRVARILRTDGRVVGAAELLRLTARIREHIDGLGVLQDLAVDGVTDILVNADGSVWVDDATGLHPAGRHLDATQARALAVRLATAAGRRLDDASPWADAHLSDGTRLHAVLPPLSTGGTLLSLRRPARVRFTLADLERAGTLSPVARQILTAVVTSRAAFVISGGTGSGKTTLLSAMLQEAPALERIVVVEDAGELDPEHPHVVHLQARHANTEGAGAVDMAALVRQCLRMRPDRVVVGECRGAEVRELLQALNTGHDGGCGTLHANTAADVPARLEALGALGGLDPLALATQAASALELVIHLERHGPHRRVDHMALLERDSSGRLRARTVLDLSSPLPQAHPGWGQLAERLGIDARLVPGVVAGATHRRAADPASHSGVPS